MISIVVQAGGESRRMGRDKGLVDFLGEPLIQRVIARVCSIADEIIVTTNKPKDYRFLNLPLQPDIIPNRGALGGLYTALHAASHSVVGVIACDMPFVNSDLLKHLFREMEQSHADIVIPRSKNGLEPLHAVYRRETCLPHIREAIKDDKWRVDSWFAKVERRIILPDEITLYDPDFLSFLNVNTPEELQIAEKLALEKENKDSSNKM
jgi:molybdopterin-guanine dinucleotide biosynthesis protein A